MHYKIGKSNRVVRHGKATPKHFGALVLVDYICPNAGKEFREIATRFNGWRSREKLAAFSELCQKYGKGLRRTA